MDEEHNPTLLPSKEQNLRYSPINEYRNARVVHRAKTSSFGNHIGTKQGQLRKAKNIIDQCGPTKIMKALNAKKMSLARTSLANNRLNMAKNL
jgi:hypothetical protein